MEKIKQDIYQKEIPPEMIIYLFKKIRSLLDDLSQDKSTYEHSIEYVGANLSFILERVMFWRQWVLKIPALSFDSDWKITIVPPFSGAIVRFIVEKEGCGSISVYLDCYDIIGCVGQPYWELYPYGKDAYRVMMNDTDELISKIREAFTLSAKELAKEKNTNELQ